MTRLELSSARYISLMESKRRLYRMRSSAGSSVRKAILALATARSCRLYLGDEASVARKSGAREIARFGRFGAGDLVYYVVGKGQLPPGGANMDPADAYQIAGHGLGSLPKEDAVVVVEEE
ncbi:MAG: hypothetical protein HY039_00970 [Nitrospirae bacterium]|nr:hypothetical protein [Nitrospirota bacterium]